MNNEEVVQALQHLIGTPYEASIKASIAQLTGRKSVIGPKDISTMQVDPQRVRIAANDAGTITGFTFG
ncbi:MAG: hypothetical protein JWP80_3098 [Pseudomonas sp.]|nr:hypothetical protein [Pseudomonas sp.]